VVGCDVSNYDELVRIFELVKPEIVINCISLAKNLLNAPSILDIVPIYTLLPHRLARLCSIIGARLVHISTDGVFTGLKGQYTEKDIPDARDIYGISKHLGEVNYSHAITLRTSIIGPELKGKDGFLEWFLSQQIQCRAFSRAIFSGFPTNVLAEIIRDIVIPRPQLSGVYHVATQPISKLDLLRLIAHHYGKDIELVPDCKLVMDRSLDSALFSKATGYFPPSWPELIDSMHSYHSNFART
jgi:dTDP-4-dehydrorhamnose reductase